MRIKVFLLFNIIFSAASNGSYAQDADYAVEYLTIDQGLPQNEVTSIIQDNKGFLWFGTRGGLARFDGYNIKIFQYEPGNKNSLSNNSIETLYASSDGKIWIGTKSGGLNCFDPLYETFNAYQFDPSNIHSISGDRIVSIAESRDGTIWAGTWGNGLNALDRKTGEFHRLLTNKHVLNLKSTQDGAVWFIADNELFKLEEGSRNPVSAGLNISTNVQLTSIAVDENNALLFISGWEAGLIVYDYKNKTIVKQYLEKTNSPESKRSNNLYSLFLDNSKKLWMGFWGDGLKILDTAKTFKKVFIAPHLQGKYNTDYDIVLTVFQDRAGNIWIGTDGGGVCTLRERSNVFKSYTFKNSDLSSGHILSMFEDSKGRLWIGTKGGGLNELQAQEIIHHREIYDVIRDIKVNDVHTIYEDYDGTIWFGSNYGLHRIKDIIHNKIRFETVTRDFARDNSLSDEKVTAILRDKKRRFWVGTQQQGLNRLIGYGTDGTPFFRIYKYDQKNPLSLSENRISALHEDSKGRIWVGTYKGLHLYEEDSDGFTRVCLDPGKKKSQGSDIITCITEDDHGDIWVGTAGGLNKITAETAALKSTYTKKDGLPNDYINSILPDAKGNLWIGSNGGMFKFNKLSGEVHLFNVSDGLQSNAFSENAACKSRSGLMYFGGINGFDIFDPAADFKTTPSPLSFISLKIMNKEIGLRQKGDDEQALEKSFPYTKEITLTHLDKVVSIEVSSLDFTLPEKNQYAFKLEGFDDEWFSSQNRREVTYTNLKAGTYTLLAKSSDVGNVWVGQPIALKITVLPPPWETWWAYMIYFTVIFLTGFAIWIVVKKQMKLKAELQHANMISAKAELEKQKEKEMSEMKYRFFTNVSHELKTPLTLIISPLEELLTLRDTPGIFREKLQLMQRHSGRLLTLINQLLDLRKSESGNMKLLVEQRDIVGFVFEVFESFTHLAEKRNITYTFHSDIDHLLIGFDQNKIEMAVTNILSNAFKYTSDAGEIYCHIAIEKDNKLNKAFCAIRIHDTGMGMPKDALDKIFDLYYQVAVVDSVKISGTGIGLALVKEIIQLHDGVVTVSTIEGRGSEFTIKLPLKQVHVNGQVTPVIAATPQENNIEKPLPDQELQKVEKPLLLIIEDTDELRSYVAGLLRHEFHVLEAATGEEGLKCASEKIPDIIVSDVMMEKMDGFELCNKIKNNEKTSHIPVILLTAKIMPENELSGLDAGADDYIKKPFNPTILIARIRRLLDSRKALKEYYSRKVTLQPTNIEITPYDERFLQKAMAYIEANLLNTELTAESLGYELGMSHSTLYRKIRALTGHSINEFMRSIRLKRAAQLLELGEYSVSEVAFQTGFSEVKYFRTHFKQQFGCLPSEYAKPKDETVA